MWRTCYLIAMSPTNIPRVQTVSIDLDAALFLFAATILTTIGFGLVPALQASSVNVNDTLKEGARGSDGWTVIGCGTCSWSRSSLWR
jgi:hypothetical protein